MRKVERCYVPWKSVLAIFLFLVGNVVADLSPSRVHLVATHGDNLLFRGNLPLVNGTFAYDELMSLLEQRAQEAAIPFPKHNRLTIVSLNNVFDLKVS